MKMWQVAIRSLIMAAASEVGRQGIRKLTRGDNNYGNSYEDRQERRRREYQSRRNTRRR